MPKKGKSKGKSSSKGKDDKYDIFVLINNILSLISSTILCFIIPIIILHLIVITTIKIGLVSIKSQPDFSQLYDYINCADLINSQSELKTEIRTIYNKVIGNIVLILNRSLQMLFKSIPFVNLTITRYELENIIKNIGSITNIIPEGDRNKIVEGFKGQTCPIKEINTADIDNLLKQIPGVNVDSLGLNLDNGNEQKGGKKSSSKPKNKSIKSFLRFSI